MDKFYTTEVTTQGYYQPQEYTDSELRGRGGIYQIRNVVNGKVYVGSSVNLINRRNNHFRQLRKNIHHNIKLQCSYNKHGESSFVFEVVEFVDKPEDLISREQYWIDKLEAVNKGYNICPTAGNTLGFYPSEESRRKMSEAHKGEKSYWYGKHLSEETRRKMSESRKGQKLSPEQVEKLRIMNSGKGNPMYGRHNTEKTKRQMSLIRKGTNTYGENPRAIPIICLTDGKKFDCIQRCAEYYHRDRSSICYNMEYRYLDPKLRFMFLDKYNELIEQGLSHEDIIRFHRKSYKKPCKP